MICATRLVDFPLALGLSTTSRILAAVLYADHRRVPTKPSPPASTVSETAIAERQRSTKGLDTRRCFAASLLKASAGTFMPQAFQQLFPHPLHRFLFAVLPILEWAPEPEYLGPPKWRKYRNKWIEFAATGKPAEHKRRQFPSRPLFTLSPVQYHGAVSDQRQDLLGHIVLPDRTIGIHEENVLALR
jgi:hypothetical protein